MFTSKQMSDLQKNKNVLKCTRKTITYHPNFKKWALKQYYGSGIPPQEIFIKAGFDLAAVGSMTPKDCLRRWRKTLKVKGMAGLYRGRGGGRTKTKNLTDKERIEYLEAKVAYLKAENDFLAKLRADKEE